MTDNIRVFVGDEVLSLAHCKKWAKDLNYASISCISSKEEMEELISPMFFGEESLYVWKNPVKEDIASLEEIIPYLPKNKYLAIISKSIDKRLNIYKILSKNIFDVNYILYSDKNKCIKFISRVSGFEDDQCLKIYQALGPKEIELPNRNGNKVPTAVLNTDKLINEIEKMSLYDDLNSIQINKIITKSEFYNSWSLLDSIFNSDHDMAIRQINYLVKDMNDFLMTLGLIISEAKIGLLVASSKNRNPQYILSMLNNTRSKNYILDSNSDDKKSKLEVHPYRIIKMSQRMNADFANNCANIIKICQKYNGLCRNDMPILFLINSFILDIIQ